MHLADEMSDYEFLIWFILDPKNITAIDGEHSNIKMAFNMIKLQINSIIKNNYFNRGKSRK